jgi:putative transposase
MTLHTAEFIRRFLLHVLPKGFHRIRDYGLLMGSTKAETIATVRELLSVTSPEPDDEGEVPHDEPKIVGGPRQLWRSHCR